jgi:hypothetical protein
MPKHEADRRDRDDDRAYDHARSQPRPEDYGSDDGSFDDDEWSLEPDDPDLDGSSIVD